MSDNDTTIPTTTEPEQQQLQQEEQQEEEQQNAINSDINSSSPSDGAEEINNNNIINSENDSSNATAILSDPTTRSSQGPNLVVSTSTAEQQDQVSAESSTSEPVSASSVDQPPLSSTSVDVQMTPISAISPVKSIDTLAAAQLPPLPKQTVEALVAPVDTAEQAVAVETSKTEPIVADNYLSHASLAASTGAGDDIQSTHDDDDAYIRGEVRFADEDENENENEDEEDDDNVGILDGDHPLMARVQAAIEAQLQAKLDKLDVECREKEEQVRKTVSKREDVGINLYNLQQQLARLQAMLEQSQDSANMIRQYREESERNLKHTAEAFKLETEKKKSLEKNVELHKQELEKINQTLRQIDLYSEDLRGQISIAKRTTLKAEEDIRKQEIEKKRQDYFIDNLTEQLRKLQERRAIYDVQIEAQRKETSAANATLQEAYTEMEALHFEKRQLLHQWKTSLFGLQKRSDVMQKVEESIAQQEEQMLTLENEMSGLKTSLRKAAEEGERLGATLRKLENENEYVKKSLMNMTEQKEKLNESYAMYAKTLQVTEGELAAANQERNLVQSEINSITKATEQLLNQTHKLESEIAIILQDQIAIDKGAQTINRDNSKIREIIHDKESQVAAAQNELAVLRLDALNVSERLHELRKTFGETENEAKMKNSLIEKYENDNKKRHDESTKKQGEMDLLNKKLDQLTSNMQHESMGPLENTIYNMKKSITEKEREGTRIQQFWLKNQNELVSLTKKNDDLQEEMKNLKMRLTVLSRKKAVVNNQFDTEEKEIREHQRNIKKLQLDMIKINTLIMKHTNVQTNLEENNFGLEQEFRGKLKEAELTSIHLEQEIERVKDEREQSLRGLVEAERQIMLWEKKIQLAKETRSALDPTVGASELREMTKEIHRMRLRYQSMLKLQEKMITEMERSVYRRETIQNKSKTRNKSVGQISLQKTIAELTKKLRQTVGDIKECEKDMATLIHSQERVSQHIDEAQESCVNLEMKENELSSEFDKKTGKKMVLSTQALLYQKKCKFFEDLRDGKYVYAIKDSNQRNEEINKQKAKIQKVDEVVRSLEVACGEAIKTPMEPIHAFVEHALIQ